ncbi:MAG TPA: M64 family metallopeptidase [Bacteroidales bacterium]|nr:M64 family metallopeptidase [Bacteroidales bacterium]
MRYFFVLLILFFSLTGTAQETFSKYFNGKELRFDFMFSGNFEKTLVYPAAMKEQPFWGGPAKLPQDSEVPGNFRYELFDEAAGKLIYVRGFSTLFQEWQTTAEATTAERSFYEVATMPFPLNKCRFVLSKRQKDGTFSKIYESVIDPADYFITREEPVPVGTTRIYGSGDPATSVDLAFIAEGYTAGEMEKFRNDVKSMADALFAEAPYKEYKDKFNIWAVEAVSAESGTDIPGEHIYANTALNSTFYTFNLDRYLTTTDIKSVNDLAASVPRDNIIVLINTSRYGGGGVYNYYSGTSVDHQLSKIVFIHEFGHGFAGLADEYYSSTVAYDEFYPLDVEPWEPNITTMVDFEKKWKNMIKPGTPVPTPAEEKYANVTGLFEGGGYSAKGIFRPELDCRMKSNGPKGYCSVCSEAVRKTIEYYIR